MIFWKKKWQSDHIFRAKKRRKNRHIAVVPETKIFDDKWVNILVGIWVSRPWQTDNWDLGFKTLIDEQMGFEFQDLDRRTDEDPSFKTSIDKQTRFGFQDLDRRTDEIWVSGPRQTNKTINIIDSSTFCWLHEHKMCILRTSNILDTFR
jgi:hypothetical protein